MQKMNQSQTTLLSKILATGITTNPTNNKSQTPQARKNSIAGNSDAANSDSTNGSSYSDLSNPIQVVKTTTTTVNKLKSAATNSPPNTTPTSKPSYKLIKCIGFGGYGRVYEAVKSDDNSQVIIKLIPKSGIVNWSAKPLPNSFKIPNSTSTIRNPAGIVPFEIECLLRLRDMPGIIRILDFFEETTCFVIVMEKLHRCTTLFDLANGKPFSFSQSVLRKIFTQLIKINLSIFAKGIVHRDIKPENILVNLDDYSIKLIDFGSAANFKPKGDFFHEFQGTLECMPPEWVLNGFYESESATVWSIGVTFYFCIFGKYPYRTKHAIAIGKYPLSYSNVSGEYLNFLDTCFLMSYLKRSTLNQLYNTQLLKRSDISTTSIIKQH